MEDAARCFSVISVQDAHRAELLFHEGQGPACPFMNNRTTPLDGMTATTKEIVQSYRRLYRHGLQAVQYSSPSRHTLKDRLQRAYRNGTAADFDAEKIENTIEFLRNAAKEKCIEHRIVKSLLHVWWWEKLQRYANSVPSA